MGEKRLKMGKKCINKNFPDFSPNGKIYFKSAVLKQKKIGEIKEKIRMKYKQKYIFSNFSPN